MSGDYQVSRKKVGDLMETMRDEFPDLKIVYKDEPMPTLWLKIVVLFFKAIGLVAPGIRDAWMNNYSNGLWNYILLPSKKTHGDFSDPSTYGVLRHEFTHMLDQKDHPIWFHISYMLVLPAIWTMRAHWEVRGYTQQMIVEYELLGRVEDSTLDWIASQFTDPMYVWMYPFPDKIRTKLEDIRKGIENGDVKGYNPDVGLI